MKKQPILLLTILLSVNFLFAQINYSFTTASTTFNAITNATSPFLVGNGTDPLADEGYVNFVPIGFSFHYNGGAALDELAISTNGFISFASLSNSYLQNNLNTGANGERPIVAPLWDDLNLNITSNLTYTTTGSAPNRIFTVQWLNTHWGFGASEAAISIQVKLYETKNWIEFIYQPENGNPVSPSASIGLTATNTGNNNFLSIGSITMYPLVTLASEYNNVTDKPANAISFMFKPGSLPINLSSFNVHKENEKNILQWTTLQEINNHQFNVQRSANGINFSTIAIQPAIATNEQSNTIRNYAMVDAQPINGTNYYRLEQVDKDGKITYSSIVSIKNIRSKWASINIYPNPVKNNLQINIDALVNSQITLKVIDIYGRQLIQSSYNIATSASVINIPIHQLNAGVYYVQLLNVKTNEQITQQFIKQ